MSCSLVMLAGPSDAGTMRMMFRHADRMSRYPFQFRALTIDTLPSPSHPTGSVATAQLIAEAKDMLSAGEIDAIFRTSDRAEDVEMKHFGHLLKRKRDFRGIPLLGWALGIERAPTDLVCHFDSDILMHTSGGFSWVATAIAEIENRGDILFVAPRGGPPADAGSVPSKRKVFSSRRFVVDRRRLASALPLPAAHTSWKRKAVMLLGGRSSYWNWEFHVQQAVNASPYSNLWLGDSRAWFIHCPVHNPSWRAALPELVQACERGIYPPQQAGEGELELEAWLKFNLKNLPTSMDDVEKRVAS